MMKTIFISLFSFLIFFSCYYDNREELYPTVPEPCDTSNYSFSTGILPILQNNCLGCHSTESAQENGNGLIIESYSDARYYAESGQLMGALRAEPDYTPMPYNAGSLSDCKIQTIQNWIDHDFPE